MKKLTIISSLIILQLIVSPISHQAIAHRSNQNIQVYFSPGGEATEAIQKELRSAKSRILIQTYEITSPKIEKEIAEAHRRGINVEIILDKTESGKKDSKAPFLFKQGVTILTDKKHPKSHNKVIIIDEVTVITGSYNLSKNAEKNAENIVIIHDLKTAEIYIKNFKEHAEHSKPFDPNNK